MGQAELLLSEKKVFYVGNFGYNFREILVATFVANIFGDLCGDCLKILWILFKANLSKRAFWIKVVYQDIHEPFILTIRKLMKYIVKMQLHKYTVKLQVLLTRLD